jgi:NADH-quinone oxidoreductase subunit E
LCISAFAANIIKMERTQDKQDITEPLMNRINELISHYPADKRKSALLLPT